MTKPEPEPENPPSDDPDSPGVAATKPLDDPALRDVEPNEPA